MIFIMNDMNKKLTLSISLHPTNDTSRTCVQDVVWGRGGRNIASHQ